MAITYKDISQLTQKSTVAGTEKLPVSDTEYITPAQIGADYLPLSGGTMSGSITFPNNTAIRMQDSGGTARGVAHLGTTNLLQLGYDTAGAGYDTRVSGNSVSLRYGTSRTEGFTLDSSGNVCIGNAKYYQAKDSGGTARNILGMNSSNNVLFGYATAGQGYDTSIYGNNTRIKYGTSRVNGIELTSGGLTYVNGIGGYDGTNAGSAGIKDLASVIHNITISSSEPTSSQGSDGDIWIVI